MSFDISFLGASGGCLDGTTCAVLVKPRSTLYSDIISGKRPDDVICVDAGSGLNLLSHIIRHETSHKTSYLPVLDLYDDSVSVDRYIQAKIITPFSDLDTSESAVKHAWNILHQVSAYLISHPHLDHIAALAINSPAFAHGSVRQVYGAPHTINALQDHIFNGVIWPNMPKFNVVKLFPHKYWQPFTVAQGSFSVTMFDISHGKVVQLDSNLLPLKESVVDPNQDIQHYISSAFLITLTSTNTSLLIFGDFESDAMSLLNKNKLIWTHIAPLIVKKQLLGIILECSSSSSCSPHELYGHLMPAHLIAELTALQAECHKVDPSIKRPLEGFNIVVTHVKDVGFQDPRRRILSELELLNQQAHLGIQFSVAISGVSIVL